jgi:N-acetyl-gamma-glutamyl-phosphate reductase
MVSASAGAASNSANAALIVVVDEIRIVRLHPVATAPDLHYIPPNLWSEAMSTPRIFIDGESGTTGLQIRQRLAGRRDIELISVPHERRRDPAARAEFLNAADCAILCLPDDAAREAVSLVGNDRTRVIDASTAHRVADGWTFGFAELEPDHEAMLAAAKRVANPGCYSTGAIALLRPLVRKGLLSPDYPVTVQGLSGYTGGGKALIERFEGGNKAEAPNLYLYGTRLAHKHQPEMTRYAGLSRAPVFVPHVGRYAQGMIVEVPLHRADLTGNPSAEDIRAALAAWYAGKRWVQVADAATDAAQAELDPEALNGTNSMVLHVFASPDGERLLLAAVLDNLGKGASGACVQALNLMFDLDPLAGLEPTVALGAAA